MKHLKHLFTAMLLLCCSIAAAHDFEVDGIFYYITDNTNKTVAVTYSGNSYSEVADEYTGSVVIPETVTFGDVTYSVTTIRREAFNGCSGLTSVTIPNSVTSIERYAFNGCSGLTSVTIPNSVTTIGNYAFSGCYGLTSVTIGDSVTSIGIHAFDGCYGLTSVTIPNSVTTIGNYTFSGCYGLTSVTIGNSVTSIGGHAFNQCSGLTSVTIPNSVTTIGECAFYQCPGLTSVTIGNSVTSIGEHTFSGCYGLTSMTIPNSVTTIGNYAFSGCSGLTSVTIPNSVTSIGNSAFGSCSGLTSVTIGNSVTTIGSEAFKGCSGIGIINILSETPATLGTDVFPGPQAIIVPEKLVEAYKEAWNSYSDNITSSERSVRSVEVSALATGSALRGAIGDEMTPYVVDLKIKGSINSYDAIVLRTKMPLLRKLDLSEANITASDYPYYGTTYCTADNEIGAYMFQGSGAMEIKLPQNITAIGNNAFASSALISMEIPNSVTTIGSLAFYNCRNLKNVVLPDNLKEIGQSTFDFCFSLESIAIPKGVTSIGSSAFDNCNLKKLLLPPALKTIGDYAFRNCDALEEVHIPSLVKDIASTAFGACNSISKVYAYTVEPLAIGEGMFPSAASATLYAPTQSRELYYFAPGWKDFVKFEFFDEPYESIYVNDELVLNDGTGYFEGTDEKGPDAEINGGIVVEGEQTDEEEPNQNFGDVDLNYNGEDKVGSIIADNNLHIDQLHIRIDVKGGRWYFFAFPFDIPFENISMESGSDYVFRYYDGSERAKNGHGGWKDINENHLKAARGYIFQCSANDVLVISKEKLRSKKEDKYNELIAHISENLKDASWNFTGNPYLSYYDLADMDYTAPVTVWDGSKYVAIRPGDDDYHFAPYEAFFVQKPENKDNVGFDGDCQMTKKQSDKKKEKQAAARRARSIDPERLLVNIELSDGTASDRTRVVFNERQASGYETACDAAKFSTAGVTQLYTIDSDGVRYAINERPADNGKVLLGYSVPAAGLFTIDVKRMDTKVLLVDTKDGSVHDFAEGSYTFSSDAGTFENRFEIMLAKGTTAVEDVETENGDVKTVYDLQGRKVKAAGNGIYIINGEKQIVK